jgi:tetratricopeptide (TPR) repeat protein
VIQRIQSAWFVVIVTMALCLGAWSQAAVAQDVPSEIARAAKLKSDGNIDEARKLFDALLTQLRSRGPSPELTDVLNNLGDIANNTGQYDRAVELAQQSADVCRKLANLSCEAKARNDAGLAYSNGGKYPDAGNEFEEALKLSNRANDGETTVLILNNIGNLYYYEARYSEAFKAYDAADTVTAKNPDAIWSRSWRAVTRVNLATLYQRLGNDQRAINVYHAALDNAHDLTPREVAHVLANLGVLYRRMGDIEEAIKNYHDAEKFYNQQKDTDGELGVLKNIGIAQVLDLNRLDAACRLCFTGRRRCVGWDACRKRRKILRQRWRLPFNLAPGKSSGKRCMHWAVLRCRMVIPMKRKESFVMPLPKLKASVPGCNCHG